MHLLQGKVIAQISVFSKAEGRWRNTAPPHFAFVLHVVTQPIMSDTMRKTGVHRYSVSQSRSFTKSILT